LSFDITNPKSKIPNHSLFSNEELKSDSEETKWQHLQAQTEFIKSATHELKSLTHAIIGYSQLLQMDLDDGDNKCKNSTNDYDNEPISTKRTLQVIVRSADELQKLINKVIDVAENCHGSNLYKNRRPNMPSQ
jgi:signal transduction histidine kinase